MAEFDTISQIGLVYLTALVIVGLLGNIVTIIVFQKGHSCKNSKCATYFKALAVADIYVLLVPCMELLLWCLPSPVFYRNWNEFTCKFAIFNIYFGVEVSTWIIIAVTVDRMLIVCYPFKFRNSSEAKWIYVKLAVIVVFFVIVNLYQVIINRMTVDGTHVCYSTTLLYRLFDMLNMIIFIFFLPLVINGTCNVLLVRTLYLRAKRFNSYGGTERQTVSRYSEAHNVTYRVVAICAVHFLTTSAFSVTHVYIYLDDAHVYNRPAMAAIRLLNLLYYTNSAVNFFLYVATGNDFRQDLLKFFRTKRYWGSVSITTSISSSL